MCLYRHQSWMLSSHHIWTNQRTEFHHFLAHGWEMVLSLCRRHTSPDTYVHPNTERQTQQTGTIMEDVPNSGKSAETCPVCLDQIREKKTLKCRHSFCSECIALVFRRKPACPICNTYHGEYTGTQPDGTMTVTRSWQALPGFEDCGSIVIEYFFPSGIQGVRRTL